MSNRTATVEKHLVFHCGVCRTRGEWNGNVSATANVATWPPPDGWAFLPRFMRVKESGIVLAVQVPVCSEACAKRFVATQGHCVPEVEEVLKAVAVGAFTGREKETSGALSTVPTLPPREKS